MNPSAFEEIAAWVTKAGLIGRTESELMAGFCRRLRDAGIPLARAIVILDTLHPIYEGRAFLWRADQPDAAEAVDYGRTNEGEAAENWRRSAFFHLLSTGEEAWRCRLFAGDPAEFVTVMQARDEGMTDYLALVQRFAAEGVIGEMDCVYSSWATDSAKGFADSAVTAIRRLAPFLNLAVKSAALARMAGTLAETYLGRDPGRRVMSGRILRGVAEKIGAVLWYSDLHGYTHISDTAPPEQIIPLLNDYADVVVSAVHRHGGDVLKLVGDGTLAIFTGEDRGPACLAALAAAVQVRKDAAKLNRLRAEQGLPTSEVYLALHVGDVFYGNVGSKDRLDFTVIGPAVNEVSRILAMSRSVEQDVLLSATFADALDAETRRRLVSVGRYALRGVAQPQELFTLEPGFTASELLL
ncbi:MAG: adenylate/guanylate cyclase domain-containing protein [Alphaproteobacteria bacterium]|nr:adenylate/guanylate cyclase domain-containing protein [Alphaproteobacteria bacterium]